MSNYLQELFQAVKDGDQLKAIHFLDYAEDEFNATKKELFALQNGMTIEECKRDGTSYQIEVPIWGQNDEELLVRKLAKISEEISIYGEEMFEWWECHDGDNWDFSSVINIFPTPSPETTDKEEVK